MQAGVQNTLKHTVCQRNWIPSHMVLWINSVKYFVYNICFPNHAGWCTEHTKTYVKETGYNC